MSRGDAFGPRSCPSGRAAIFGASRRIRAAVAIALGGKDRRARWDAFYARAGWNKHPDAAAVKVQQVKDKMWWILKLVRHARPRFSFWHRIFNDPPTWDYEPYYNEYLDRGGNNRVFSTWQEARDFYQLCEGVIDFEEYCLRPHEPLVFAEVELDASGMEAPSGGETGTGSTEGDSPAPKGDAR